MRARLIPVILKLNEIIVDHESGLDPLGEHEAEAMRLICFAKDVLTRARAELAKAEIMRENDRDSE